MGGIVVYLHPAYARPEQVLRHMARTSFLLAISDCARNPDPHLCALSPREFLPAWHQWWSAFAALSAAFAYSGMCVCLALTKFPSQVSQMYAADLVGAATGCVFLIAVFKVTDGVTAVFLAALLASLASLLFSSQEAGPKSHRTVVLFSSVLAALVIVNTIAASFGRPLLDLFRVKGKPEGAALYEKWNSFSRLTVFGDPTIPMSPVGDGTSPTYPTDKAICQLRLEIDAAAETTLTSFSGDLSPLDFLQYDVKEIVHYVRPNSKVFIIGAGGGRDVLAALAFKEKSVRAVEMNRDIVATLNKRFGDFTGHLDRNPAVTFVNDEARSYLARTPERFDIIQASFIDTWAATAAGAYSLTENGLYTVEGWQLFLSRLTPGGVVSFSRWFIPGRPQEAYRLTALATATLGRMGISDPRRHIILVRNAWGHDALGVAGGAATMLIGVAPFSDADLDQVEAVARRMRFVIVLSPRQAADANFSSLASESGLAAVMAKTHLELAPPTDNRPFFFQMGTLGGLFRAPSPAHYANEGHRRRDLLGTMLLIVVGLTILCIVAPLWAAGSRLTVQRAGLHVLYFAAIGLGFMMIEVSQMQRLMIFLGHPTYALAVVLFTLLLASGLGSLSTQGAGTRSLPQAGAVRLGILLVVLCAFGMGTQQALVVFRDAVTPVRILVGVGILFPLGFLMGMAFPLGLKAASGDQASSTPWLWGINGATSVCASVLAVIISLYAGISAAFWTGVACYAVAWLAFLGSSRSGARVPRVQMPA